MKNLFQAKILLQRIVCIGMVGFFLMGVYAQPGLENKDVHTVRKGETLYRISRAYSMSVSELKQINGLSSNRIFPGQNLYVTPKDLSSARSVTSAPSAGSGGGGFATGPRVVDPEEFLPTATNRSAGDLSYLEESTPGFAPEVATNFGTSRGADMGYAPSVPISDLPSTLRVEKKKYHLVKKGEDLFSLSDEYGVSPQQLRAWNPDIRGTGVLDPGQAVVVRKWFDSVSRTDVDRENTNTLTYDRGLNNTSSTQYSSTQTTRGFDRNYNSTDISAAFQGEGTSTYYQQPNATYAETTTRGPYVIIPSTYGTNRITETGTYVPIQLSAYTGTQFYGVHKSLPEGSLVRINLPNNAGYINVKIMGRLEDTSRSIIGLSPACVRLLKSSGNPSMITLIHL